MEFSAHGVSHKGYVRETNADRFVVGAIRRSFEIGAISAEMKGSVNVGDGGLGGTVLVVADGIGASKFGHEAAALAVDSVISHFSRSIILRRNDVSLEDDIVEQFAKMILSSHDRLQEVVKANPEMKGMATTLTLAFVLGSRAWLAHVGDSRGYMLHEGELCRLTKDQTIAQMLVDQGALDQESADSSRLAHILASSVGGSSDTLPTVLSYRLALEPGDSLVLCTDGLTKHVTDDKIAEIVSKADTPTAACDELISRALDGGGTDNVTVVVGVLGD